MLKKYDDISIPVCSLNAVSEQPNKVFVSDTTNCFYLHFKLFLSLAPEIEFKHEVYSSNRKTDPIKKKKTEKLN